MSTPRDILHGAETDVLVLGCGRWMMGDDQLGLLAAQQLAARALPGVAVELAENPDTALTLKRCSLLVLIDAARSATGGRSQSEALFPGRILKLDGRKLSPSDKSPLLDTHSFGVRGFLQLAEALDQLPDTVWIYTVVGSSFTRSDQLSSPVVAALGPLVNRMAEEISAFRFNPALVRGSS